MRLKRSLILLSFPKCTSSYVIIAIGVYSYSFLKPPLIGVTCFHTTILRKLWFLLNDYRLTQAPHLACFLLLLLSLADRYTRRFSASKLESATLRHVRIHKYIDESVCTQLALYQWISYADAVPFHNRLKRNRIIFFFFFVDDPFCWYLYIRSYIADR